MTALRRAFIGASIAWMVALLLTTFAASRPHHASVVYLFALAVYGVGRAVCHQLPERSFHLWAAQMPVCARCTGIYAGAAIASIVAAAVARPKPRPANLGRRFSRVNAWRAALMIGALPTLLTLAYEGTSGHMPANWIRAAAGVPIGVVAAWLIVVAADNQVN